jgi:hypothetical protein
VAQFVPDAVLIKIRVNPKRQQRLKGVGIKFNIRTIAKEHRIIRSHEDQAATIRGTDAKASERDAYRGQRTDAGGTAQPDSGTPIFGWDKEGRRFVSICEAVSDLQKHGFVLQDVHMYQKETEQNGMAFLCFWFKPGVEPFAFTAESRRECYILLNSVYGHVHGFRNPDRTMTFTAAHLEDEAPERVLHIERDWSVSCEAI